MEEQQRQVDLGVLTDEEVHALIRTAWTSANVLDLPEPGPEPALPDEDTGISERAKYLAACAAYESARKLHDAARAKKVTIATTVWHHVWRARGQAEMVKAWRAGRMRPEVLRLMDIAYPGLRRKLMREGAHAL